MQGISNGFTDLTISILLIEKKITTLYKLAKIFLDTYQSNYSFRKNLSQFMRPLMPTFKKSSCYDEQKYIFEHFRNVKLITNLFNCTINLKTFYSVHRFSTALYELMFVLHKHAVLHLLLI